MWVRETHVPGLGPHTRAQTKQVLESGGFPTQEESPGVEMTFLEKNIRGKKVG